MSEEALFRCLVSFFPDLHDSLRVQLGFLGSSIGEVLSILVRGEGGGRFSSGLFFSRLVFGFWYRAGALHFGELWRHSRTLRKWILKENADDDGPSLLDVALQH